jgi:hypothetical protein
MEGLLELGGVWLARIHAFYGLVFLAIPAMVFADTLLLAAVVWAAAAHARGRVPWPFLRPVVRRRGRLALEIAFGLVHPVIYLAVLVTALRALRADTDAWSGPLTTIAWALLVAFWNLRLFGGALDLRSRVVRGGVQALLLAALACVLAHAAKDLRAIPWSTGGGVAIALALLRLAPLYLIPAVLLGDHLRSIATPDGTRLFLLRDRTARLAVAAAVALAAVTFGAAAYRRSDAAVQRLLREHRGLILAAARQHDVDPRLIAAVVYVTHRDQLSPFRDTLERLLVHAWAANLRRDTGQRPPERIHENGTDENPMLNRALDISVGVAQIKPRTAQTASVLATGRTPDELPVPVRYSYVDIEPVGAAWREPLATWTSPRAAIPVPAERHAVAEALLDPSSNLAVCALILSLYQRQWEATSRDFSLRERPEILATLYQIGFARSKPHAAPRPNDFGRRVREVYDEAWMAALFAPSPVGAAAPPCPDPKPTLA